MVKDFTKEDIPVLGRLVSISDDNTVANAEQIWDAKNNLSIQDTVNDFDNRITSIEGGSSLTQEQKNILRFIQDYSTIYQYAEPDSYDDAFDVNNLWLRYDNANLEYKNSSIDISGDSCLSICSRFNSNYGNTSALYINASKASDVTAQKWAILVTGGDCKFKDDLMVEGTIRSIEGFETQEGSVAAWDGIFENLIISQNAKLDDCTVDTLKIGSTDDISLVDSGLTLTLVLEEKTLPEVLYPLAVQDGKLKLVMADSEGAITHAKGAAVECEAAYNTFLPRSEISKYALSTDVRSLQQSVSELQRTKQNTLSAGTGISIVSNTISCTVSGGGQTEGVIDPYYVHTDNNYTDEEKAKLAAIEGSFENGIWTTAEINVQSDWNETDTSSDAYILNKPTALSSFTNDMQFVTRSDIATAGAITATDIAHWNAKADAATSLSGYGIKFDPDYFEDDETDGLTFTAQYITDHPVKMTQAQGASEWSTAGDNKVPTVGAVYNKFLAKDDSTVVKTVGDQTIDGNKTFSKRLNVLNLRSTESNTQSSNKFFATDGTIGTFKTINGEQIVGTGNITTTYSNFTSPTNNAAGVAGLVPAPAAGTQNYILGATGWVNPSLLVEDDVTVIITPTDANIRMIMTLAANMTETLYNAAYSLNTSGFTFTINGQQYSYNEISQMKRSKFKFEFSSDFAYNASTQNGFTITSHKFIPYDHSDMLVIYAIRDDDEAFVFGFASSTFMFGALGPDLQYNKLKIKYNASDNNNRLFSVLSQFYQVFGMKSDIVDLVSHKLIYDATPVTADLQYAGDNIAFYGLIGSTDMTSDGTGLSFSARPEYGLVEYRNGVLVV